MATPTKTFQGVTYTNGNLPKRLLAPLDGNNLDLPGDRAMLRLDAAASWNRARAEVERKTGIVLTVRGWNRTKAEQKTFYLQRHAKWTPGYKVCCYWDGVPYRFTGTAHASPPGTSNHGWGLAVDVVDFGSVGNFSHPRRKAAIGILKRHGWTDDEGRGSIQEPWHLVYNPARDQHKSSTSSTPTKEEFLMALSDRDQEAVLWTARKNKALLEEIRSILASKVKDGSGAAEPRAIWERTLDVSRRTLAQSVANAAAPVDVDVDANAVAEALLARLPKETAKEVVRALTAQLQK